MTSTVDLPSALPTLRCGSAAREDSLLSRYNGIRGASVDLCSPLSPEDCQAQSMEDASPAKWHLAHTTWFFETFILEHDEGYRPFRPEFRVLFNSYYNTVGRQHPRPQRGLLTRPSLDEVLDYRAHVDRQMSAFLESADLPDRLRDVVELGLHHEQQHQELILTDVKHLFARNPLRPSYRAVAAQAAATARPVRWWRFGEREDWIGHSGPGFSFDNERPRHRVLVRDFELAGRLVTNGEFLSFIRDGGYERPELWLSDGWSLLRSAGWRAPLYWEDVEDVDEAWSVMTLAGMRPLREDEPVCHVSFYEADAFARWAGARLPTEIEWELAARDAPSQGNFVESGRLHPAPVSADGRDDAPAQVFGDVWEWTQSPYVPYPGYAAPAGALGEYNGKFMCNQLVLRGGSCATPESHLRATYRNFFPPQARWQFSGIRLARNVGCDRA